MAAFNNRDLSEQAFPYVFLDATFCRARIDGTKGGKDSRVASQSVVIATGVSADGRREVLGCAGGDSETGGNSKFICLWRHTRRNHPRVNGERTRPDRGE